MKCKCREIDELNGRQAQDYAQDHLKKTRVDGQTWQIEYECPYTSVKFIMDFPESELQGGGPPRLRKKKESY
ncbi:MAG: Imm27 family immunity protein [Chloroflexota bacterium]